MADQRGISGLAKLAVTALALSACGVHAATRPLKNLVAFGDSYTDNIYVGDGRSTSRSVSKLYLTGWSRWDRLAYLCCLLLQQIGLGVRLCPLWRNLFEQNYQQTVPVCYGDCNSRVHCKHHYKVKRGKEEHIHTLSEWHLRPTCQRRHFVLYLDRYKRRWFGSTPNRPRQGCLDRKYDGMRIRLGKSSIRQRCKELFTTKREYKHHPCESN